MNLAQFSAWAVSQGTVCKTDGTFCGECVSLINQYLAKVHGINAGAWGHAKAWAGTNNPIRQWFVPVNTSQPGDIGVDVSGTYGHIWIYQANTILEQNGRVPRKVTISPDRNATVILRPKAGMPKGDNVATKVTKETLRMIHSEMEGWPLAETHAGKFDAAFWASWGGQDLEAVMWEKWNKNGKWRESREANRIFFEQNSALLEELKKNPTKAQYEEVVAKMKAEQAKAEAAMIALEAERAKVTEDSQDLDKAAGALQGIWAFVQKLLTRKKS